MSNNHTLDCQKAIDFVTHLFKVYLEDRDFALFKTMLHQNVSWIGTGAHEICRDYREAVALLDAERDSWDGHFKITTQWYKSAKICDDLCVVYGELNMVEDSRDSIPMDMPSRFSMACTPVDGQLKLFHAHFSVFNAAQTENEYVHKSLVQNYNLLLEEKLAERTKMLRDKTNELKALTSNIYGGVEICVNDEDFTILYINDGFLNLSGYTAREISELFENKHTALVLSEDTARMKQQMAEQLAAGSTFSVEYRILRKDGGVIWVLDKGLLLPPERDSPPRVQCILTDISVQKAHEDELRISKKRYEVAIQLSSISMFEYNILTKQLFFSDDDVATYGVPHMLENGMEALITKGIVEPSCVDSFREMYREIHNGEPFAKCTITARDTDGELHYHELSLTTVYDSLNKPIRAIGVRKNISQLRRLQRENEFGKTLVSGKHFACEADITNDRMISIDEQWMNQPGISRNMPFSQAMSILCSTLILPDHRALMAEKVSIKNITEAFESGSRLISFHYQVLRENGEYRWCEATINIIRDETSGSINIRYYTDDIDELKKKEQHVVDEQRLYEHMLSRSSVIYEVNITKNLFISGHDKWKQLFGINVTDNYSDMMAALLQKAIHPDEADIFKACCLRENVLNNYRSGKSQTSCEYRRPNENGDFIWVRCTYHLYEDPQTSEVRGYAYIEDIDSSKKAELALVYKAEHDSLTGFYNKAMTEKLISDFLSTSDAKVHRHAFLMIDIDHFKSINDNFGHVFGDAVLSQTSAKIATLFRDDDILGRVGGDEFVVFMKNIYNLKIASAKAEEIRELLCESYSQRGKSYQISASVGVAIYPMHGKLYKDLYVHSDSALYASKKNGRNQISLYNNMMELVESDKAFNPLGLLELRSFEDNVSEYIFRILYESKDKEASINAVLELVGKHLNVSRAYIFEDTPDSLYTSNTYEWCSEGIEPQMENLQNVPYAELGDYRKNFNEDGIFYLPDVGRAPKGVRSVLLPQHVKSMLQFAIRKNNESVGFIGFDQCDRPRVPTRREVSDCHNAAQILGVFVTEMRGQRQSKLMEDFAVSIVNALDSYAYVCDPMDCTLLFINDSTLEVAPESAVGGKCYRAFWGREAQCEECPMKQLSLSGKSKYSMELYNDHLQIWIKSTASWINWKGDRRVCLVDSVNITSYKCNTEEGE